MVNYKTATTQKEFDNNFMRAVTKNAQGLILWIIFLSHLVLHKQIESLF